MILAIIQARYNSTRFPGKILKKIKGYSLLEILISRLQKSKLIDKILVATTKEKEDSEIVELCKKMKVSFFRGSSKNVLKRFYDASVIYRPTHIVRITADCPFTDYRIVDSVINMHIKLSNDYTSNTLEPTYADGLDVEVLSFFALHQAFSKAKKNYEKEHVTPYIKNNKKIKKKNFISKINFSNQRWTVDYPEDLYFFSKIMRKLNYNYLASYKKIYTLSKKLAEQKSVSKYVRDEGSIMSEGIKLWGRAKKIIPGGNMMLSKNPNQFLPDEWPTYFSKSSGCQIWDLKKRKFYDFSLMGIGTNILGYSYPSVDRAVLKTVKKGNMTTLNCAEEVMLAEKLVKMHPWAKMVKLTRSGGEANAVAIRIARTHSKRKKIMVCGYHGWHDWYLASYFKNKKNFNNHLPSQIRLNGIPKKLANEIFIFRYNDFSEIKKIYNKNKKDIGILKMEVSRNEKPKKNFLKEVRKFCNKNKIILIFDECTSGFRENFGGLHLKYKVNPDIAILGKALGNGYAINAVLGKKKIMQSSNKTFMSSTFWTERIGPTAALATLNEMEKKKSWQIISKKGIFIKKMWAKFFEENKFDVKIMGLDAMPIFLFKKNNQLNKTFITKEMLKRGFLTSNSIYLSLAHTDNLIKKYLKNLSEVITLLSKKSVKNLRSSLKVSSKQINR